jgi:hypothetical protein
MKKVLVLFCAFALLAIVSCKKEAPAVDQKVIISELFAAGMSWNSQQKAALSQGLKSTYPINISVDNTVTSPAGGNIHVIGSVTGSMSFDDATYNITGGTMLLGLTETINDYGIESEGQIYTMNGAPYISLTGTFTLQPGGSLFGTSSGMQIGGGIRVVGPGYDQTINIDITININASGTGGDVSGVIDGVPINYSF